MDTLQASYNKLQNLVEAVKGDYVAWIVKNPGRASDTESGIKLLSYLLHGRLKKSSTILPELIYCGANILAFWHDRLIQQHERRESLVLEENEQNGCASSSNGNGVASDSPSISAELHLRQRNSREAHIQRIRTTLTIIDYLEVFLEVSARQLWGDVGRWVVIILIQSVKTGLRAALLLHFKVGLIGSSTLYQRRYNRRSLPQLPKSNVTFVLKHSGRTVRKIHSAPPVRTRDWTAPISQEWSSGPQEMPTFRKVAEIMHLIRPLTHLASMGIWGTKSWKPWLLSFAMDVSSLRLHSQTTNLRRDEKAELTRRTYALCYYLMRSPFYDTCTKKRLLGTLIMFSERIPLLGNVCGVLAQAIPEWQNTYSYMWTTY